MTNKYQEALDILDKTTKYYKDDIKDFIHYEEIYTLQELIDKNSMLEKFDKVLFFDSNGFVVEGISYAQLERALDKACEWITDNDGWVNIFGDEDWRSRFPNGIKTKEEWKEWLLKDE